jgi:methylaspartate ammonia-lyase
VEHNELEIFLRLNESYDAAVDEDRPAPVAQPIGVPGAALPLQMTPERLRSKILSSSPSSLRKSSGVPVNKQEGAFDVSTELSGFGLQGVMVTPNELADLVAELGLDGEDAGDLVRGLSDKTKSEKSGSTDTRAETAESDSRNAPGIEGENGKGKATAVEDAPAADSTSSELVAPSGGGVSA